MKQDITAYSET